MFIPYEIKTNYRCDGVIKEHEKIFFIIQQGTLDGSFIWENNKVTIPHHPTKIALPKEESQRALINHLKLFLNLTDGVSQIMRKNFPSFQILGDYTLIKTMDKTNFEIPYDQAILYLPQTNQAYFFNDKFDRDIFKTHAYVIVIPISEANGPRAV